MLEQIQTWYRQKFNDPQIAALAGILLIGFGIIYFFSNLIMPLLIAIVLAYLLEVPIRLLERFMPRTLSVVIVLGSALSLVSFLLVVMLPSLWNQAVNFIRDLPNMLNLLSEWVQTLPEHYPELIDYSMLDSVVSSVRAKILGYGESLLSISVNSLINLVGLGIYAFLVPLMVFFLLKDKFACKFIAEKPPFGNPCLGGNARANRELYSRKMFRNRDCWRDYLYHFDLL